MHHGNARGVADVQQEVAVAHRVHAVGIDGRKAQLLCHELAVERVGGAGQRSAAQRQVVAGVHGVFEALEIAREHPVIRKHVMAEEHRLRFLHVRVAGHDHAKVVRGHLVKRAAQVEYQVHEALAKLLAVQMRIRGDLIIATAARVQAPARSTDVLGQVTLDGHVDVLVVDVELELAVLDLLGDTVEPCVDSLYVFLWDDALAAEHGAMGLRAGDVGLPHALVDGQAGAEDLREIAGMVLEATAPQGVAAVLFTVAYGTAIDIVFSHGIPLKLLECIDF